LQYFANGSQISETSGTSDEAEARRQLKVKVGETAAGKTTRPIEHNAYGAAAFETSGKSSARQPNWFYGGIMQAAQGRAHSFD
jgi:hypothetical protein